jgi:hypothetical protein
MLVYKIYFNLYYTFKCSVCTAQKTQSFWLLKPRQLKLCRDKRVITVCSGSHANHINKLCV